MSQAIIDAMDIAINRLVDGFIANPWLHRVEHSLHCELFMLLKESHALSGVMEGKGFTTQLVHKEWPEPQKSGTRPRRGNFDLAVLKPTAQNWGLDDFRYGRAPLVAAIEIGLNYSLRHLQGDLRKLQESGVPNRYLIHFATPRCRSQKGVIEAVLDLIEKEQPNRLKIAYVDHSQNVLRKLGDTEISSITTE
ncbi:hypothetical protein [Pedosphaera parvula]|uniref:Uncharacterized protein n=1 Tax=Pedosphaera parvula (strain Ellin514) TaxID=320771 RepID=B9X9W9_PEDPL|nr:hypothetical protein [Pedosphaera parvula]EEF63310.1 hypothetical protein Cflav_PD5945 [Pedosphaera parvula Ellin514]